MAEEISSLAVSLSMDASSFNGTVSQINRNMKAMGSELQAVKAQGKDFESSIDGLTQKQDILQRSASAAAMKLQEQRKRYDELVQSGKATAAQIERQATAVNQAQAQYNRLNTELKNVSSELADATNKWKQAGSSIGEFGEKASATGGKLKDIGGTLTASLTAPIVAFGAAALATATQFDTAQARLQGQLGVTAAEAEKLSGVAQEVWKKGFGDDIVQVTDDLAKLKQYIGDVGDADLSNLLESSYMLQDLFGADIQESARTASVMMKTFGIDGQEAMDLITVGFQRGGDFSGELLDTLREYSPQFKALGYDAEAFTSILIQGSELGVFQLDKLGDSAKESFLRVGDGSKSSRDALEALGLNFQQIENDINSGGETANSAFAAVASAIALVQDPAEKSRLAVALMGTPIEDLGPEFQNFFANVSTELAGFEGAASKAAETLQQSFGERLQSTWRTAQTSLLPLGETLLDIADSWLPKISSALETATNWFNELSPGAQNATVAISGILAIAGPVVAGVGMIASGIGAISGVIAPVVTAMGGFGAAAGTAGASAGIFGGAIAALSGPVGWAALGIAAVGTAAIVVADQLSESSLSVSDWTSKVSESTAETLGSFMELGEQATVALNQLAWSGQTVTAEMATNMISVYDQMGQQVLAEMQSDHSAQLKQMTDFFSQSVALTETEESAILATIQAKAAEKEAIVADGQARIAEILNTAASEKRAITEAEQAEINAIQQTMTENAISYMTESQAEQKAILETLKSEAAAITAEMAAEVVQNSVKQKDEVIAEAEEQYSQTVQAIIRQRDEMGTISAEQADKLIEEAQRQRDETIASAEEMHQNVVSEAQAQADEHVSKVDWATGEIKSKWQVMKDGVIQAAKDIGSGVKNDFSEMYEYTSGRVSELKEAASNKFNEMKQNISDKMAEAKTAIEMKWNEAVTFLKSINLADIGRDVVTGFVNGIRNKLSDIGTAAAEMGNKAISALSSAIQRKSPARKFIAIGEDTGEGYAIGIEMKQSRVEDAMKSLGQASINIAEETSKAIQEREVKLADDLAKMNDDTYSKTLSIRQKAAKEKRSLTSAELTEIQKIETSFQKNKLSAEQKAVEDINKLRSTVQKNTLTSIQSYIANKKSLDELSAREEAAIWEESLTMFAENTDERVKAQENHNKALENVRKTDLNNIQSFIDNQKSLNQWSLSDEATIWREALDLFAEGTDERIKVQQNYQKAVETINKEIESINKAHQSEMQKIIDESIQLEQQYSDEYANALNKRKSELVNFAGIFDQITVDTTISGQQLMENLASQVVAMEDWSANMQALAARGVNDGLLAELRALGPKALSEIAALTQLTDEQLQIYEQLWQEKSAMATDLAIQELEPLQAETDAKISALHESTEQKLDALADTWKTQIEAVTSSVESGLEPLEGIGSDAVEGLIVGLAAKAPALQAKAAEIANSITETMRAALDINSPSEEAKKITGFFGDGLITGLINKKAAINAQSAEIADSITTTMRKTLGINSDSKEAIKIGGFTISGLVTGLAKNVSSIKNAATSVASNLLANMKVSQKEAIAIGTDIVSNVATGVTNATSSLTQGIKDKVRESMYSGDGQTSATSSVGGTVVNSIDSSQANEINKAQQTEINYSIELAERRRQLLADILTNEAYSHEERLKKLHDFISRQKELNMMSVVEETKLLQTALSSFHENSEERVLLEIELSKKLASIRDEDLKVHEQSLKERMDLEKEFISERKRLSELSLADELQLYEKFIQNYAEGTQERIYYERQIQTTKKAIYDQLTSLNKSFSDKITSFTQQQAKKEVAIHEELANKTKQITDKRIADEKAAWEKYDNDYAAQVKKRYNEYGLFEQAKVGKIAGSRLTLNLESQMKAIEEWQSNMTNLEGRGVDDALVKELQEMGMDAAGEVKALTRMSDTELSKYVELWRKKSSMAKKIATKDMVEQRVQTEQQIAAMRANAEEELQRVNDDAREKLIQLRVETETQLALYQNEWSSAISKVRDGTKNEFNAMVKEMPEIGKNVIKGMQTGLNNAAPALYDQVQSIADNIRDTINAALSFASQSAASAISTANSITAAAPSNASTSVDNSRTFAPQVTVYAQDSGASEMERTLTRMQYGFV